LFLFAIFKFLETLILIVEIKISLLDLFNFFSILPLINVIKYDQVLYE